MCTATRATVCGVSGPSPSLGGSVEWATRGNGCFLSSGLTITVACTLMGFFEAMRVNKKKHIIVLYYYYYYLLCIIVHILL